MIFHDCECCGRSEERVFIDTWTAKKLCLNCLGRIALHLTNSPHTEGDNLDDVLEQHAA